MSVSISDSAARLEQIPGCCHDLPPQQEMRYLIDGRIYTRSKNRIPVYSPVMLMGNGQLNPPLLGMAAQLDSQDALLALDAAERAYGGGTGPWPMMTISQRTTCMKHFLSMIRPLADDFARLEMWEIAKPLTACRDEFQRTMKYIEDTMAVLEDNQASTNRIMRIGPYLSLLRRTPLGVVLCMGPYNYPLNETFAMMIPALLMGNPVIVKPPQYGCLCTLLFLEAFAESFPPRCCERNFRRRGDDG